MANPITWRNINAPNFSDSNRLAVNSANQLGSGLDRLAQAAQKFSDNSIADQEMQAKLMEQDLINNISQASDLSEVNTSVNDDMGGLNAIAQANVLKAANEKKESLNSDASKDVLDALGAAVSKGDLTTYDNLLNEYADVINSNNLNNKATQLRQTLVNAAEEKEKADFVDKFNAAKAEGTESLQKFIKQNKKQLDKFNLQGDSVQMLQTTIQADQQKIFDSKLPSIVANVSSQVQDPAQIPAFIDELYATGQYTPKQLTEIEAGVTSRIRALTDLENNANPAKVKALTGQIKEDIEVTQAEVQKTIRDTGLANLPYVNEIMKTGIEGTSLNSVGEAKEFLDKFTNEEWYFNWETTSDEAAPRVFDQIKNIEKEIVGGKTVTNDDGTEIPLSAILQRTGGVIPDFMIIEALQNTGVDKEGDFDESFFGERLRDNLYKYAKNIDKYNQLTDILHQEKLALAGLNRQLASVDASVIKSNLKAGRGNR